MSHGTVEIVHERENPGFLGSLTQKCGRKRLLSPASLNAKNSPSAACALCRWRQSQRGKHVPVRVCLTRARTCAWHRGNKGRRDSRSSRATVGEQHPRKSICATLRRAAAVMRLTAGSHFFYYLITLNWQVHLSQLEAGTVYFMPNLAWLVWVIMYSNRGNHRWSLHTLQPILTKILSNFAH